MRNFSVNIDAKAVQSQYEAEQAVPYVKANKFDERNYLQARLQNDETTKTLTIRLLPFTKDGGTPFKKVYMHTVKVNKAVSPTSGWKTFVCPVKNADGNHDGNDKCPFCETSRKAYELKKNALDEPSRKMYGDIEFMNRAKEMWVVRCIERGHEEDGVKFWMFSNSKKKDGVYDKIMNLAKIRHESAKRKGNEYSIFDLNNGLDLIVTLNRTADKKTTIQIVDDGVPSPLTNDYELGMKWINDDKRWLDVYTIKPYDYMSIIAMGGIPKFDSTKNKFVDISVSDTAAPKAELDEKNDGEEKIDYSAIANGNHIMYDTSKAETEDDDLPY